MESDKEEQVKSKSRLAGTGEPFDEHISFNVRNGESKEMNMPSADDSKGRCSLRFQTEIRSGRSAGRTERNDLF